MCDDDECCICLSSGGPFLALPVCGHRVHVSCGLHWAQCSNVLRCPLCRNEPFPRVETDEEGDALMSIRREVSRALRREGALRRRCINTHPQLLERWRRLKTLRRDINTYATAAQRAYERRCREVYRDDPEIRVMRHDLQNMRRRERRLKLSIDVEIDQVVYGPRARRVEEVSGA
tara:strand:+ start:3191 stop:3715 length:525 start_codon:yes stop_codon:yes gene_type:complete